MKISKFLIGVGIGWIFVNSLNEDDYNAIQNALLTKIYQFEPKLLEIFYQIDNIINTSYDERSGTYSNSIQDKINEVENQIKQVKTDKLSKLLIDQVNKGK